MTKPELLESADRDLAKLTIFLEEHMSKIAERGRGIKDFEHYLFEMAMEAAYGPDVWSWYNENNTGDY